MAISEEDIKKAAREAAIRVVKPTPCVCGLGSWDSAFYLHKLSEALYHEREKEFISLLPGLQEKLDRLKDQCGINVNTAQLQLRAAELSVKAGKLLDALSSLHTAFWEIDKQLTNGAAREIKETE